MVALSRKNHVMNSKEQAVWAWTYNQQKELGASDVDAYLMADRTVADLAKQLGNVSGVDNVDTETPAEHADRVTRTLKQCVQSSFVDVRLGAGNALVAMLVFAAQRVQDPPTPQAQHHHVRCEVTRMRANMSIHAGACFVWKKHANVVSPCHSGVVTKVMDYSATDLQSFDAIVYGPCPPIGAVITFDAPAITINGDGDVVVSPVLARVTSIVA